MNPAKDIFQLSYNLALIEVEKVIIKGEDVYKINFSNEVPELLLARRKAPDGRSHWNSIPPGNTELAASIGALIENYKNDGDKDQ